VPASQGGSSALVQVARFVGRSPQSADLLVVLVARHRGLQSLQQVGQGAVELFSGVLAGKLWLQPAQHGVALQRVGGLAGGVLVALDGADVHPLGGYFQEQVAEQEAGERA